MGSFLLCGSPATNLTGKLRVALVIPALVIDDLSVGLTLLLVVLVLTRLLVAAVRTFSSSQLLLHLAPQVQLRALMPRLALTQSRRLSSRMISSNWTSPYSVLLLVPLAALSLPHSLMLLQALLLRSPPRTFKLVILVSSSIQPIVTFTSSKQALPSPLVPLPLRPCWLQARHSILRISPQSLERLPLPTSTSLPDSQISQSSTSALCGGFFLPTHRTAGLPPAVFYYQFVPSQESAELNQ